MEHNYTTSHSRYHIMHMDTHKEVLAVFGRQRQSFDEDKKSLEIRTTPCKQSRRSLIVREIFKNKVERDKHS